MSRRTGSSSRQGLALAAAAMAAALALSWPAVARAAMAIQAGVDRRELAQDEVLTLELRVEADEAPSLALPGQAFDFTVVSRASSRQASFDLGGGAGVRIRQTFVFQFGLAPRRTGELTIPPIEVTAGKATTRTEPITVTVTPAGQRAQRGQAGGGAPGGGGAGGQFSQGSGVGPSQLPPQGSSWSGWERDLGLSVELDRTEVFLGEQVTASVWLLSPVGVVSYEGYRPPLYDGFWSEEVETPQSLNFQVRNVNGVPVRAYLLQRLALFPTRAGELELGSYQADLLVRVGRDSPFDMFPEIRRVQRKSRPIAIHVKPLPPGAPAGFDSVNVGKIALTASLSEATAAVGQPVTLRITAQGEGNVKAWSLPSLPRLGRARTFAPTTNDKVAPARLHIAGSRAVETVLVAEQPGTVVVPPISWPIFDPTTGVYRTLSTGELKLEVLSTGPGSPSEAAAAPGQNALGAGLRPIRAAAGLERRQPPPWQGAPFWILLGAPVALFAGLAGFDRLREQRAADGGARRLRLAGRVASKRLAGASKLLRQAEAAPFFAEVERALVGYCADKLGRPASGLTREALTRALAEAGAHPPAVRALTSALDACDAGRYGGASARAELLALAGRAITLLEEAHWSGPGGMA